MTEQTFESVLKRLEEGSEDREFLSNLSERLVECLTDEADTERKMCQRLNRFPVTSLLEVLYALNELEWESSTSEFVNTMKSFVQERRLYTAVTAASTLLRCHKEGREYLTQWATGQDETRWEAVRCLLEDAKC